jgi:hypothetical protein
MRKRIPVMVITRRVMIENMQMAAKKFHTKKVIAGIRYTATAVARTLSNAPPHALKSNPSPIIV